MTQMTQMFPVGEPLALSESERRIAGEPERQQTTRSAQPCRWRLAGGAFCAICAICG
jgi:hypothetical protein